MSRLAASAHDVLETMLALLVEHDLTGLLDLYASNAVHELPYLPDRDARRLVGRAAIADYYTALEPVPLDFHELRVDSIHDTDRPGLVIAEIDGHGERLPGREPFTARYVWVLLVVDGQIAHWRDYWNPADIFARPGA